MQSRQQRLLRSRALPVPPDIVHPLPPGAVRGQVDGAASRAWGPKVTVTAAAPPAGSQPQLPQQLPLQGSCPAPRKAVGAGTVPPAPGRRTASGCRPGPPAAGPCPLPGPGSPAAAAAAPAAVRPAAPAGSAQTPPPGPGARPRGKHRIPPAAGSIAAAGGRGSSPPSRSPSSTHRAVPATVRRSSAGRVSGSRCTYPSIKIPSRLIL